MQPLSPLATVLSGQKVSVSLHGGYGLDIFVRQMPARHLVTKFMSLVGSEAELLEAICTAPAGAAPLPEGWVDALTDESHAMLVKIAHELNFTRAVAQFERETAVMQGLSPLTQRIKSLQSSFPVAP